VRRDPRRLSLLSSAIQQPLLPRAIVAIITYPTSWYFRIRLSRALPRRDGTCSRFTPLCTLVSDPGDRSRGTGATTLTSLSPQGTEPLFLEPLSSCHGQTKIQALAVQRCASALRDSFEKQTRQQTPRRHIARANQATPRGPLPFPLPSHRRSHYPTQRRHETFLQLSSDPRISWGAREHEARKRKSRQKKKALERCSPSLPFGRFLSAEKPRVGYSMKRLRLIWI
jgi:hypothetical protein